MIKNGKGVYLSILTVFISGVLLSLFIFAQAYHYEFRKIKSLFDNAAAYRFQIIENTIGDTNYALESFGDFYAASEDVSNAEFETFAKGLFLRQPYIFEFRFLKRVRNQEREAFEAAARKEIYPKFHIYELGENNQFAEVGEKAEYFSIIYDAVSDSHRPVHQFVLGLNAASFPERWLAMQKARDSAAITSTGPMIGYGESDTDYVLRMFLPIYRNNSPRVDLAQRQNNLNGFVALLFNLDDLIKSCLRGIPLEGLDISIYYNTDGAKKLFYIHSSSTGKGHIYPSDISTPMKLSWSKAFKIADQDWELLVTPSPYFISQNRIILPWIILFIGLVFTLFFTLYLRDIIAGAKKVEGLVNIRTSELRKAEEKYRVLYHASADAIMTLTPPDWHFASGNPATVKLFALKDEQEFVHKKPWDLSPEFQPDGQESLVKAKKMIDEAIEKGSNLFEWAHKKATGEVFPATVLLSRMQSAESTYLQATVRDITELKKAENALELANKEWSDTFNAISDFVFILDKNSVITKVNESLLNAMQVEEKDVVGRVCFEVLHKKNSPWPTCPHQQTLADKNSHTEEVIDPGLGMPLLVTTSPIFDDRGEMIGSVHIAKDISTIKKTENELMRAKEELEVEAWGLSKANNGIKVLYRELEQKNEELKKVDQLKSDFVSIVSHELRTPLAIMKEGVSLVLDRVTGEVNAKTASTLEMVYNNINRLAKLISDLLDISKIEAGRLQLKKALTDINLLVRDAAEKWIPAAGKRYQELVINAGSERLNVYVDPDKLIQILNNLLSNAIKFTPDKGRITVEVKGDKNEVGVSVVDTGTGIPSADLPKVFGKFQQFDRPAGGGAKGTGLGLAICKELVELHEGTIKVESKPGAGTKFSFTIPRKDSETVFKEHISEGIKDVSERNSSLSLISMRISEFGRLQKELGPDRTHDLLKEIEKIISESLRRKADTVVRDTGELMILLFDTSKEGAQAARGRIEDVIRSFLIGSRDEVVKSTTFNVGIACYPEEAKDETELLDKARGIIHA
jgi:diguanylate cyclase (GGDEF)-like protein/PAS domain S-box-containing protein